MIPENIFDDTIEEIAGHDVIRLVNLIKGKSLVSEFKIAEKLEITVNQVRNMLYKLDAYTLVDFARKKDKVKGWYVYYWTLNLHKLRELAVKMKKNKFALLTDRIAKEERGEFFTCPDKHIRMNQENAMDYEFRCPECDIALVREENNKILITIKKQIDKLSKEVELLNGLEIKPVAERKLTRAPKEEKKSLKKKDKKKPLKKKKVIKKQVKKKSTKKKK